MTVNVTIPITDDGDTCTSFYTVRYRPSYAPGWYTMPPQLDAPIVIPGLQPSTQYFYEITRTCCDSSTSATITGDFTTPNA